MDTLSSRITRSVVGPTCAFKAGAHSDVDDLLSDSDEAEPKSTVIDIIKPETIKKFGNELGKKILFYEIKSNIFEIDYKYQLKFANKFYQNYKIVERNLYPS